MKKILPVLVLLLIGCGTYRGKTSVERTMPDGSSWEVKSWTPSGPKTPANINVRFASSRGKTKITTGTGRQQSHDFVMEGISGILAWIGGIMIFIGLLVSLGAGYIPLLNWMDGLYIMAGGAGVIWLPIFFDRYTWLIVVIFVVAGAGIMIYKEYEKDDLKRRLNGDDN